MTGFLLVRIASRTCWSSARCPPVRLVAGQIHRRLVIRHDLPSLHVLGHVNEHRPRASGLGDVKGLLKHASKVFGARNQVVVFGDRPANLDDRRLLKCVRADDRRSDLPREDEKGHRVHLGVSQTGDEVGSAWSTRGQANTDFSRAARISLGCESTALLVARQNRTEPAIHTCQGLVNRHAGPAGIGKDHVNTVVNEALDQNIGAGEGRWRFC